MTTTALLPPPPTYTMRCRWTAMSSTGLPPRVVASPAQLVILNALYARTGDAATKEDVEEVSRETGLQEKWIRRWIKRQRTAKGGAKKKVSPRKVAGTSASADGPGVVALRAQAQTQATLLSDGLVPSTVSFQSRSAMYAWQAPDPLGQPVPGSSSAASDAGCGDGLLSPPGSSWCKNEPVQDPLLLHTSYPLSGHGHTHSPSQTAPPQVAHPGASFTVPLRFGPPNSQHRITRTISPGYQTSTTHFKLSPTSMPADLPPSLGYPRSDFSDDAHADAVGAPSRRVHFSHLSTSPLHMPSRGFSLAASDPPLSAPPSAFSLPAPAASEALNSGGAYLYRLFNDPGNCSAAFDAPSFHSTCYLDRAAGSATDVHPHLWASPHALNVANVAADGVLGFAYPPTPVSYQMQMSDLVALTNSIRARGAVSDPIPDGDAATSGAPDDGPARAHVSSQSSGADCAHPRGAAGDSTNIYSARDAVLPVGARVDTGVIMGGEESEDEDEVVTPCEEMYLLGRLGGHPTSSTIDACGRGEGRDGVEIADGKAEEDL